MTVCAAGYVNHSELHKPQGETDIESKGTTSAGGPGDSASPARFTPDPEGLTQLPLILQQPLISGR